MVSRNARQRDSLFTLPRLHSVAATMARGGRPMNQRIVQLVESYVGCSVDERCDELGELVARGVDDPQQMVKVRTNCGTFALGIWHAVGVDHVLLSTPYENEKAIAWIVTIAHDLKAVRYPKRDGLPVPGALMHYWLRDGNLTKSHHVEFCLSAPDRSGIARHAGGGRPQNTIGVGESDIRFNVGRPLQCWYDPSGEQ